MYNHRRPHQALNMACPADRFRPSPVDDGLELWAPPDLEPVTAPAASAPDGPVTAEPLQWPDAVEIDRVVPASGNMSIGPRNSITMALNKAAMISQEPGIPRRAGGGDE